MLRSQTNYPTRWRRHEEPVEPGADAGLHGAGEDPPALHDRRGGEGAAGLLSCPAWGWWPQRRQDHNEAAAEYDSIGPRYDTVTIHDR